MSAHVNVADEATVPKAAPSALNTPSLEMRYFDEKVGKMDGAHFVKPSKKQSKEAVSNVGLRHLQIIFDGYGYHTQLSQLQILLLLILAYTTLQHTISRDKGDPGLAKKYIIRQIKAIKQLIAKQEAEKNKQEIEFEKILLEERNLAWVKAVLRVHLDGFTVVKSVPDRMEID